MGTSPGTPPGLMSRSLHLKHTGRSPTRTGFTRHGLPPPLLRRDHPRSRGVYTRPSELGHPKFGSSPLARGLLLHRQRQREARGIIPARAGFTWASCGPWCRLPDHPRSRGVYGVDGEQIDVNGGSSPLARGLLSNVSISGAKDRIIPARAGFTCAYQRPYLLPGDHPRSRGVYP